MGMAASQARFLGLTARKTNTEYEGQQVNQQRTLLANKSANYYNDLLGMTVPVPPSVEDYTKTVYTFTDGAIESSINSLIAQANGTYLVNYTRTWTNDHAVVLAPSSIVTRTGDAQTGYTYKVGAKVVRQLGSATDEFIATDEYLKTLTPDQIQDLMDEERLYAQMLSDKYGLNVNNCYVIYRQNTTTKEWVPTFYDKAALDAATYSETGSSQSFIQAYTVGSEVERSNVSGVEAELEKDASGRYINITFTDANQNRVTYALTTTTTTDQAAYESAHNQYEYDKAKYEKSVQDINSKIEIIQAEDRTLELRLKQLDTERKAIETEMEAVSKVIDTNTKDTFKTFNS